MKMSFEIGKAEAKVLDAAIGKLGAPEDCVEAGAYTITVPSVVVRRLVPAYTRLLLTVQDTLEKSGEEISIEVEVGE